MTTSEPPELIIPAEILEMIEAILFVAPTPTDPGEISRTLGLDEPTVTAALGMLKDEYDGKNSRRHGFELGCVNGKWRIYARARWFEVTRSFISGSKAGRLSHAALETLAIVAYRQPISRTEVADIRGVNSDSVIRNLLLRGLIEENEKEGSAAVTLRTTDAFLELFNLENLSELPPLAPAFPTVETLPATIEEIKEYQ